MANPVTSKALGAYLVDYVDTALQKGVKATYIESRDFRVLEAVNPFSKIQELIRAAFQLVGGVFHTTWAFVCGWEASAIQFIRFKAGKIQEQEYNETTAKFGFNENALAALKRFGSAFAHVIGALTYSDWGNNIAAHCKTTSEILSNDKKLEQLTKAAFVQRDSVEQAITAANREQDIIDFRGKNDDEKAQFIKDGQELQQKQAQLDAAKKVVADKKQKALEKAEKETQKLIDAQQKIIDTERNKTINNGFDQNKIDTANIEIQRLTGEKGNLKNQNHYTATNEEQTAIDSAMDALYGAKDPNKNGDRPKVEKDITDASNLFKAVVNYLNLVKSAEVVDAIVPKKN